MSDFFNTTNEVNPKLEEFKEKAKSQNEIILKFLLTNQGTLYSPDELWLSLRSQGLLEMNTPLTSVRRSLTNLTKVGPLKKSEAEKKVSLYGRPTYCWYYPLTDNQFKLPL